MAALSLREYVQKIENLIETNEIEQAIAHCKYILKMYPKHIDSYRLLGKAFLEKQKFSDASDIFQRVLSSIPDDFISHIGMSIIREDENNLDASIWHMERAFEVQPSNKAVQDELRRLYTKRDGIAPPKIRLTRGALVRMYVRGELYEQAIGEITKTLEEDPNRIDLEVILAKIYFLLGQKVEATEICSKVISKLPYCFEANKILTDILPGTTREEDQKIFRQRVIDLDPYFEFTSNEFQTSDEIPDSKIMIDYLEWDPFSDVYDQTDWTKSIGLSMGEENSLEKDISFWINSTENEEPQPTDNVVEDGSDKETPEEVEEKDDLEIDLVEASLEEDSLDDTIISKSQDTNLPNPVEEDEEFDSEETILSTESSSLPINDETTSENDLPEWLKDAGWQKSESSDSEVEKGFSLPTFTPEEEGQIPDEIEPGNIPDWIKEIAPTEKLDEEKSLNEDDEDEIEFQKLEDLISKFGSSDNENILNESITDWKTEFEEESELSTSSGDVEPEEEVSASEESEENVDWLKSFTDEEIYAEDELTIQANESAFEAEASGDQSDESSEYQPEKEEEEEEEELGWLSSLIVDDSPEDSEESNIEGVFSQVDRQVEDDVPDWIKSVVDEEKPSLEAEEMSTSLIEEFVENKAEVEPLSEDEQEPTDEFKISFDESDNIPETSEFEVTDLELEEVVSEEEEAVQEIAGMELEEVISEEEGKLETADLELEEVIREEEGEFEFADLDLEDLGTKKETEEDYQSDIFEKDSELVGDEEEEKIAYEALSQLEEEMLSKENELTPLREVFEESEFGDDTEEILAETESEKDNLESTLAWMAGISAFEASQKDFTEEQPEEAEVSSQDQPDWLSKESESATEDNMDFDSTPSWLKELEIEAESISEKDLISEVIDISDENIEELELSDELIRDKTDSSEDQVPIEFEQVEETEEEVTELLSLTDQVEEESGSMNKTVLEELDSVEVTEPVEELEVITTEEIVDEVSEEKFEEVLEELEVEEVAEPVEEIETSFEADLVEWEEDILPAEAESQSEEIDILETEQDLEILDTPDEFSTEEEPLDHELVTESDQSQISESFSDDLERLEEAKRYLGSGEIDNSLGIFDELIKKNVNLEDIITSIQSALDHQYPINIDLWKTLGDAYFRDNQLQKALDAYSKAEDLLS